MFTRVLKFFGCLRTDLRVSHMVRYRTLLAVVLLALCVSLAAAAQQREVTFDPSQASIEWSLGASLHTVHGTFKLRSGAISFDPVSGNASGEFVVDAASGDSGNRTRDGKMDKEVLESERYPEITFLPKKLLGKMSAQGSSTVQVQGVFHIHGIDHDLTLSVPVQVDGTTVKAKTSLSIPYQTWGMKNPSTLFLHVDDKVQVSINAVGKLTTAGPAQVRH
jgi:polyisoprenoid-binding protein YceI